MKKLTAAETELHESLVTFHNERGWKNASHKSMLRLLVEAVAHIAPENDAVEIAPAGTLAALRRCYAVLANVDPSSQGEVHRAAKNCARAIIARADAQKGGE